MAETSSTREPIDFLSRATRREQIFFHAARLFCTRGFAATTMSEIADAVGITKPGLYHFVSGKEELLFTLMMFSMDRLEEEVIRPARAIGDPVERLNFIIRGHLLSVAQVISPTGNPLTIIIEEPAGLSPENAAIMHGRKRDYFRLLRDTLVEVDEAGGLADADPGVAAFAILGIILWLARWHRPDGPIAPAEIVRQLHAMALRAVLKPDFIRARGLLPPD
jgi:AcrR family transcriptional regulator